MSEAILKATKNFKTCLYSIPTFQVGAWSGFTNQPANDGVEVLSSSASDTQKCTIWGTTFGTNTVVSETVTLNGTTAVATAKVNWGNIYGVVLGDADGQNIVPAVGTITIRKKTGALSITTIAAGKASTGMVCFNLASKNITVKCISGNLYPSSVVVPAVANVAPLSAGDILSEMVPSVYRMISDGTGASAAIWVWSD